MSVIPKDTKSHKNKVILIGSYSATEQIKNEGRIITRPYSGRREPDSAFFTSTVP